MWLLDNTSVCLGKVNTGGFSLFHVIKVCSTRSLSGLVRLWSEFNCLWWHCKNEVAWSCHASVSGPRNVRQLFYYSLLRKILKRVCFYVKSMRHTRDFKQIRFVSRLTRGKSTYLQIFYAFAFVTWKIALQDHFRNHAFTLIWRFWPC